MNYLLSNPIGIDKEIQAIQKYLYDSLVDSWGKIDAHGRAYKNRKKLGFIPEVFLGNNEYKNAYYSDSDNKKGIMFFIENQDHSSEDGNKFTARVKICFMLNLDEVMCEEERQDVAVQSDVVGLLNKHPTNQFIVTGIEKGVRNIFNGYEYGDIELEADMHPLHSFAIIGDLEYYLTEKCS